MEEILLETMFDLPSLEGVDEAMVNREVIEGRAQPLYAYAEAEDESAASLIWLHRLIFGRSRSCWTFKRG